MSLLTQDRRPIAITTPLGKDRLLLESFTGTEALSEPFLFHLELLAENPVDFRQILGKEAWLRVDLPGNKSRAVHGIVSRFTQGGIVPTGANKANLIRYRAELRPKLWLLSRRRQSRIFQHLTVPQILERILKQEWQLDVEIQATGRYFPREYCAQYRETDLNFVSRLMEDEGIFYYFEHGSGRHRMIVSDLERQRPEVPDGATALFSGTIGGRRGEARITQWEKSQEVCPHQCCLWDYHFQLPDTHLEAKHKAMETVRAGTVTHHLRVEPGVDAGLLEIYDHGGDYAHHHDGIDKTGAEQPANLQHVFEENGRIAQVRIEEETASALQIQGVGDSPAFLPGYKFALKQHFDGDGGYVLTRVEHQAGVKGTFDSGGSPGELVYTNRFLCIPEGMPFRPARGTPKPRVDGPLTAEVVGPADQPIYCDKFGRVRIQMHWDRQGKKNIDSSCWVRVAQGWGGNRYGMLALPRVGQEVVVAFLEGDPDRPMIQGCVSNPDQMPPTSLPHRQTQTVLKSHSEPKGPFDAASGLAIDDHAGQEHLHLHSELHMTQSAQGSMLQSIAGHHHQAVGGSSIRVSGYPGAIKQPPPQGSGSGGGSDPVVTDTGAILRDAGISFGFETDGTIGTLSELVIGQHLETTINPLGAMFPMGMEGWEGIGVTAGFFKKLGISLGSAHTEVTLGGHNEIQHGTALEFKRGPEIENASPKITALSRAAAALYATVAIGVDVLLPVTELAWMGNSPLSSSNLSDTSEPDFNADSWAQVGEKEAMGLLARLILDGVLALWIGVEMKCSAAEQETALASDLENLAKLVKENASEAQATALVVEALGFQAKAKQQTIDGLVVQSLEKVDELRAGLTLASASTRVFEGLYSVTAHSMAIEVHGKADQEATVLSLKACGPPENLESRASVNIYGKNMCSLWSDGGAMVETNNGVTGSTGSIDIHSGRYGSVRITRGHDMPNHAVALHESGVKVMSTTGGIHILHSASAKLGDMEAAESPRKILIESKDSPVEVSGDRVVIKAMAGLRIECGASFIEFTPASIFFQSPAIRIVADGSCAINCANHIIDAGNFALTAGNATFATGMMEVM